MATSITSFPYTITAAGHYQVNAGFTSSDSGMTAITVNADDVVIDLNGFTLSNSGAGTATLGTGIYCVNRKNITVRNGTLRYWRYGIRFEDTTSGSVSHGGHVIENMRVRNCTFRGMTVQGVGNRIMDCHVVETGGNTFDANSFAMGIELSGPGAFVKRNSVFETYPVGTGESLGISISNNGDGFIIEENACANQTIPTSGFGVWVGGGSIGIVERNNLIGWPVGIQASSGNTGSYRNNNAVNCTTQYASTSGTFVSDGDNV